MTGKLSRFSDDNGYCFILSLNRIMLSWLTRIMPRRGLSISIMMVITSVKRTASMVVEKRCRDWLKPHPNPIANIAIIATVKSSNRML